MQHFIQLKVYIRASIANESYLEVEVHGLRQVDTVREAVVFL